jgi:hypothetical protein
MMRMRIDEVRTLGPLEEFSYQLARAVSKMSGLSNNGMQLTKEPPSIM